MVTGTQYCFVRGGMVSSSTQVNTWTSLFEQTSEQIWVIRTSTYVLWQKNNKINKTKNKKNKTTKTKKKKTGNNGKFQHVYYTKCLCWQRCSGRFSGGQRQLADRVSSCSASHFGWDRKTAGSVRLGIRPPNRCRTSNRIMTGRWWASWHTH